MRPARLVVWLGLLLVGCAARPVAAPPVARPAPPVAAEPAPPAPTPGGAPIGTTASGGIITTNAPAVPAVVDSTPSADALAVLRTIPDPSGGSGLPDSVAVPVPAPTRPLGDPAGTRATAALPETLTAPQVSPTPLPPAATLQAAAPTDSCWRVQVAAPPERDRAERMAEAASSQLAVPFVIEREGGLHKVRVRDCLSAAAAAELRRRAEETGFAGAFRFQPKPR